MIMITLPILVFICFACVMFCLNFQLLTKGLMILIRPEYFTQGHLWLYLCSLFRSVSQLLRLLQAFNAM